MDDGQRIPRTAVVGFNALEWRAWLKFARIAVNESMFHAIFTEESLPMSTLTIRNVEAAIKDKLRMAAAAHGRSMEEEVRTILRNVLAQPTAPGGLGSRIHARFAVIGGVELDLPSRSQAARAADLESGGPV